jgi:hypothetical protein
LHKNFPLGESGAEAKCVQMLNWAEKKPRRPTRRPKSELKPLFGINQRFSPDHFGNFKHVNGPIVHQKDIHLMVFVNLINPVVIIINFPSLIWCPEWVMEMPSGVEIKGTFFS